jgi:hypothetical protein
MIGNSVPVNLAYFVGSNILKYVKEEIDLYDLNDCIKTNADNFSNIAIYH